MKKKTTNELLEEILVELRRIQPNYQTGYSVPSCQHEWAIGTCGKFCRKCGVLQENRLSATYC